jgi:hypothetical protein
MYIRKCPNCKNTIEYSSKITYKNGANKNSLCRKCNGKKSFDKLNNEVKLGLRENGFKGKKHKTETIERFKSIDKSYTKTKEFRDKISKATSGKNNPMYGRSHYDVWLEKYGKEEADMKLEEFKSKISKATSGKNNPMYGKPSPQGSGNGWSGWYNGIYFRSLLELSFLVNWVDRFKLNIENAEKKKYKIQYTFNGAERNYFADWIVNGKYLVEIKPKRLWNTPQNKAKFEEAAKYCKENNLIFKLIEPIKIKDNIILYLYQNKEIELSKNYTEKLKKYFEL